MTEDHEVSCSEFDALSMDAETSTVAAFYTGLTRKQVVDRSNDRSIFDDSPMVK